LTTAATLPQTPWLSPATHHSKQFKQKVKNVSGCTPAIQRQKRIDLPLPAKQLLLHLL